MAKTSLDSSLTYTLHVESANLQSWTRTTFTKVPNPYADVLIGGRPAGKTHVHKKTLTPKWSQGIVLSGGTTPATVLSIRVMHDATLRSDECIGSIDIDLESLTKRSKGAMTTLSLEDKKPVKDKKARSTIAVQLICSSPVETAKAALDDAKQDVSALPEPFETLEETVSAAESAADAVEEAESVADGSPLFQNALSVVVTKLEALVPILDKVAAVHPYVNLAWQVTSSLYKAVQGQKERDKQLVSLVATMEDVYSFVDDVKALKDKQTKLESIIRKILLQTVECSIFIREYTGAGFASRTVKQTLSSTVQEKITNMVQTFTDLKASLLSGISMYTAFISSQTLEGIENLERIESLKRLNSAEMNASSRHGCLPGTRTEILKNVTEWLVTPNSDQNILWLHGLAGSGKSTISTTIAEHFSDLGRLGAYIVFDRNDAVESDPAAVVRKLGHKLASFCPPFKQAISTATDREAGNTKPSTRAQFTRLIVDPLKSLPNLPEQGPIIIVFDAMDECGNAQSRKLHDLLATLAEESINLPSVFRILITSRPEFDISRVFNSKSNIEKLEVTVGTKTDTGDIQSYFDFHLSAFRTYEDFELPPDWPGRQAIQDLVKRSAGLFIWASTAVKFVEEGNHPQEQLDLLLESESQGESEAALHNIYEIALKEAGKWESENDRNAFCNVLGGVIVGRIPVTDTTLDQLLDLKDYRSSRFILPRLRCLLRWTKGGTIRTLHASFVDYLTKCHGQPWFIDTSFFNNIFANRSFRIMERLRFNICQIESSFNRNEGIHGAETRIQTNIPPDLSYACRFWASHLSEAQFGPELLQHLDLFLHSRALFWLEAISCMQSVPHSIAAMALAIRWIGSHDDTLSKFVGDAKRFISVFQKPIAESVPHIYLSCLPFAPSTSVFAAHFRGQFKNTLLVKGGALEHWGPEELVMEGHTGGISSIVLSHDGRYIVSGSNDKTVRIWDAETSDIVQGPMEGHDNYVTSVAISRNGQCIASASKDCTVRLWSFETGEMLLEPLRGHSDWVTAVVFSSTGEKLASASNDNTILIWNTVTGAIILGPLKKHEDWVKTVAFSDDDGYLVSGGDDNVIYIWDAKIGDVVGKPLKGHYGAVSSVAFSHNGDFVVSGSYDETVRVWSMKTRKPRMKPWKGHSNAVTCVAFSPDDKHVISSARDNTIRIWKTRTGETTWGPLTGHSDWVVSVVFDGRRIFSGSNDKTIRIWSADVGDATLQPMEGHDASINSIALSPDNRFIVSGSDDETVRLWHADTGKPALQPLTEHSDVVEYVTFSRDGKYIASGSQDGTAIIWDAKTGAIVCGPLNHDFKRHEQKKDDEDTGKKSQVNNEPKDKTKKKEEKDDDDDDDDKDNDDGEDDNEDEDEDEDDEETDNDDDDDEDEDEDEDDDADENEINCVVFSPNGKYLVTASRRITIWDVSSGTIATGPFDPHDSFVNTVAVASDNRRGASGADDGTIYVWDLKTGKSLLGPLEGHEEYVNCVLFSRNDKWIFSAGEDETIKIWDARSGNLVLSSLKEHNSYGFNFISLSGDGKRIASGSYNGRVSIWDTEMAKAVLGPLRGHADDVLSVAYSRDGKHVFSASNDATIRVWDVEVVEVVPERPGGHIDSISAVVYSSDGEIIVSGSNDRTVRIWSAASGTLIRQFGPRNGHTDCVNAVAVSKDGRRIASASDDKTIRIWDVSSGKQILEPLKGHGSEIYTVAFSDDGNYLASGSDDHTVRVWETETGKSIMTKGHKDSVNCVIWSKDSQRIVSCADDGSIRMWNVKTKKAMGKPLRDPTVFPAFPVDVMSMAFSPDEQKLVFTTDHTISVLDIVRRQVILGPLEGHGGDVTSVVYSSDGTRIISGSDDYTVRVWDAVTGKLVLGPLSAHTDPVNTVAVSPDGTRIVSGADDSSILVWDAHTGNVILGPLGEASTQGSGGSDAVGSKPTLNDNVWLLLDKAVLDQDTGSGWMVGPNGQLLYWVPYRDRKRLTHPRTSLVIGKQEVTSLDFSKFVSASGANWMKCLAEDQ